MSAMGCNKEDIQIKSEGLRSFAKSLSTAGLGMYVKIPRFEAQNRLFSRFKIKPDHIRTGTNFTA